MTNPDNIVRVRARNGGRASVYEANGWAQAYSAGILEGSGVIQNTPADMNVLVGGSATKPDVVLASNPAGYKIALDIIGQQAVAITAPASNKRISVIVAYTDDLSLATTQDTVTGSPASCGLIVVNGTAANSPTAPTDAQIRTAITSDGATGSQAAYCVLAEILVENGTTAVDNSMITPKIAAIGADNIDLTTSTDSRGWRKIPLSNKINLYLNRGSYGKTMTPTSWVEETAVDKPIDLNLSNTFIGGVGGLSSDHAINVCGYVDWSGAKARVQLQNVHNGPVPAQIYWWAYIIEFVS